MNAQLNHALFNVTFFNQLTKRRALLIDGVSEIQAEQILERFGDPSQPYLFLHSLRAEQESLANS
jgi:hypothetical protein